MAGPQPIIGVNEGLKRENIGRPVLWAFGRRADYDGRGRAGSRYGGSARAKFLNVHPWRSKDLGHDDLWGPTGLNGEQLLNLRLWF